MIGELEKLKRLVEREEGLRSHVRVRTVSQIKHFEQLYPIYSFSIGSQDPQSPVLFITGGIHGLERIGAQLAWSLLKTSIDRLIWDRSLLDLFKNMRLVVMPLLNPSGYYGYSRSNGNGVDLMRNSPVGVTGVAPFLLRGQRYSPRLPWFQGTPGVLEPENLALKEVFSQECEQSPCVIALDFHSGFGLRDRLWFPFSYTAEPFGHLPEMHALTHLFEQSHPYHIYQIEPQSKGYLLSGDMWDYLYLEHQKKNLTGILLPITLEMGSWTWVRKNPLQLFSKHGAFNPIKEHRIKRTYRRHHLLFDFLLRALYSRDIWAQLDEGARHKHHRQSLVRWYS
jgi:hypothetical protein